MTGLTPIAIALAGALLHPGSQDDVAPEAAVRGAALQPGTGAPPVLLAMAGAALHDAEPATLHLALRGAPDLALRHPARLGGERAWALAGMLPAGAAQLVVHELSHALVPALRGDPRLRVSFGPDRETRTLATTRWSATGPRGYDLLSSAMPKVVDLALMLQLGHLKRNTRSPWARGLLSALQVAALVDFLQGTLIIWRGPSRWNDAWYLVRRLEESGIHLGRGGARAALTAVAAGGLLTFRAAW